MLFLNSILLGIGLAMDAFSVSVADGLGDPKMNLPKGIRIATVFAVFQALMPMIGWVLVHNLVKHFNVLDKFVPWVALVLLLFIGIKMIVESRDDKKEDSEAPKLSFGALIVQGVATSIDALSVGFTIADYNLVKAVISVSIIGVVTFMISLAGVFIGKKFGNIFKGKAEVIGGIILILIGIEIFVKGVFF